jgi:HD-GYP domain-containing protein (c-di-GMP phosphodiesterase class II)
MNSTSMGTESMTAKSMLANDHRGAGDAANSKSKFKTGLARINQELWLVLSLFVIAGLFNWLVASHRMILGLYTLPTIFSAYVYGRRHAVLTATASIFLVLMLLWKNTGLFAGTTPFALSSAEWSEIVTWACLLLITAYAMGTLYDKKERHMVELRQTYFGLLTILQQFISNDKYTHNHSYRVAFYASSIATQMGFDQERVDDVRAAAMLHDVGKLETSRQLLYKGDAGNAQACAEGRRPARAGGWISAPRPAHHSCPSRQV